MAEQENVTHSNVPSYSIAWDTVSMSSYVAAHKVCCYSTVTVTLLMSAVA
jgi:hypothetical protein